MNCRVYLNQSIRTGDSIRLPDDIAHYLRHVMRLQQHARIILFNGRGGEYEARIGQLSKRESFCHVDRFIDIDREPDCRIHVFQAACRSEKIDTVLQKGTELGAASFHIVRSERSSLKLDGHRLEKRLQRWRKIVIEAAEQSGRTGVPDVSWHNGLTDIETAGLSLALHPTGSTGLSELASGIRNSGDISLAIGPEGGWSERDLEKLRTCGFTLLAFGERILRTETAAPALLAAIHAIRSLDA